MFIKIITMYKNREDAGRRLAEILLKRGYRDAVVIAIPRGGVVVGREIAKLLQIPLGLALIKKIGHPLNPEVAIGAVSPAKYFIQGDYKYLEGYIEQEVNRLKAELQEKQKKYLINKPPLIAGKVVILADDGIATGHTVSAAIDYLKSEGAQKIILAIPVAPADIIKKLETKVQGIVCPILDDSLVAIGPYYENFYQVTDEEVIEILNALSPEIKM
jgi:putative phosphoribosyl transferase